MPISSNVSDFQHSGDQIYVSPYGSYQVYDEGRGTYVDIPEDKLQIIDYGNGSFGYSVSPSTAKELISSGNSRTVEEEQKIASYVRPEEISQSPVFQDVNSFSGGHLANVYDSINSGAYVINKDNNTISFKNGDTYAMRPAGNGIFDITIPAAKGTYNVAFAVNDQGKALFNKDLIDAGAIRYVGAQDGGGGFGGFLNDIGLGGVTDVIQDLGPIGQIGLAFATGGLSIPQQVAAQVAYNMAGGQNFDDALKNAAITAGLSYGVRESGLMNGLAPGLQDDELIPFEEAFSGIDMGDVVPATMEQLKGLYETGGVFNPPTGIYPGENVPSGIPEWDKAFVNAGGTFDPAYATNVINDYFDSAKLLTPLGIKDLANIAVLANTANSLLNPPKQSTIPQAKTGFEIVPIPGDWRSPSYNQTFTPTDLNALFTNQNLLLGTQWENLPPEIQFANSPTMEALTSMINNGQTTISS
jgi:hypothetical protein